MGSFSCALGILLLWSIYYWYISWPVTFWLLHLSTKTVIKISSFLPGFSTTPNVDYLHGFFDFTIYSQKSPVYISYLQRFAEEKEEKSEIRNLRSHTTFKKIGSKKFSKRLAALYFIFDYYGFDRSDSEFPQEFFKKFFSLKATLKTGNQ